MWSWNKLTKLRPTRSRIGVQPAVRPAWTAAAASEFKLQSIICFEILEKKHLSRREKGYTCRGGENGDRPTCGSVLSGDVDVVSGDVVGGANKWSDRTVIVNHPNNNSENDEIIDMR